MNDDATRLLALEARLAAAEDRIAALEARPIAQPAQWPAWPPVFVGPLPPTCPSCGAHAPILFCRRPHCPMGPTANGPVVVTRFLDGTLTPTCSKETTGE